MIQNPWTNLRHHTPARIALGRAGGSLPTRELLQFNLDHAEAKDAVQTPLNFPQLQSDLAPLHHPILHVSSQVPDQLTYLKRPDLGRHLNDESRALLTKFATRSSVAIILAAGLSAFATQSQAPALLANLLPMLQHANLTLSPIILADYARVALQDEIGQLLHSQSALILLGERPGLASPDSLGAYLVFNPNPQNTDANRNCISNIRPSGLAPKPAAELITHLLTESLRRQISGIHLKDERPAPNLPPAKTPITR